MKKLKPFINSTIFIYLTFITCLLYCRQIDQKERLNSLEHLIIVQENQAQITDSARFTLDTITSSSGTGYILHHFDTTDVSTGLKITGLNPKNTYTITKVGSIDPRWKALISKPTTITCSMDSIYQLQHDSMNSPYDSIKLEYWKHHPHGVQQSGVTSFSGKHGSFNYAKEYNYEDTPFNFSTYLRFQLPWRQISDKTGWHNGGQIAGTILAHIPDDSIKRWISEKVWDSLYQDYIK